MQKLMRGWALLSFALPVAAQSAPSSAPTAEQDHQQMMDRLGIQELRPDASTL
jgi:hypothetical protein